MLRALRQTPLIILFWLISFLAVVILWQFMPTAKSQIALLLLMALVIISTVLRQTELPIMTTIFLGFMLINYWQVSHPSWPIIGAIITAIIVPLLGLTGEKVNPSDPDSDRHQLIGHWLLLGLISAEAFSIFNYWPVSFFNRALLCGIFFYTFWQLFKIQREAEKRSFVAHFVFVSLAVILVIGIIVWANFPHLINF